MVKYWTKVKTLQNQFEQFSMVQIPWGSNSHADSLATLASSVMNLSPQVIKAETLAKPSIDHSNNTQAMGIHAGPSWMDSIVAYIRNGTLPEDVSEAKKIRRKSPRYWLSREGKLYKCSYIDSYLLCFLPEAVDLILEELHGEICGCHTGGEP